MFHSALGLGSFAFHDVQILDKGTKKSCNGIHVLDKINKGSRGPIKQSLGYNLISS